MNSARGNVRDFDLPPRAKCWSIRCGPPMTVPDAGRIGWEQYLSSRDIVQLLAYKSFAPTVPGVPYSLCGARLRAWVRQESEIPSKGFVDWTAWVGEET